MKQGLIIQIIGVVNGKSTTNPDILYRKGRILNKETDKNKRSDQEEKWPDRTSVDRMTLLWNDSVPCATFSKLVVRLYHVPDLGWFYFSCSHLRYPEVNRWTEEKEKWLEHELHCVFHAPFLADDPRGFDPEFAVPVYFFNMTGQKTR